MSRKKLDLGNKNRENLVDQSTIWQGTENLNFSKKNLTCSCNVSIRYLSNSWHCFAGLPA
jgi:hypothetical protein